MNSLGRKDGKKEKKQSSVFTKETLGVVLILFSTLLLVCLITRDKLFSVPGQYINAFFLGCFGYFAFVLTALGIVLGVLMVAERKTGLTLKQKTLISALAVLVALLVNVVTMRGGKLSYGDYLAKSYLMAGGGAATCSGGGIFTSIVSYPVSFVLSDVGSYVVLAVLIVITAYFLVVDFTRAVRKGAKGRTETFRSSYVKSENDEPDAATADGLEVRDYPVEGVELAEVDKKPTQKLFVNASNDFAFKSNREMKNEEKNIGVTLKPTAGSGINVASTGASSYSGSYGSDMQQRLEYIKKPATIDLSKTLANGAYGVTVSKPIPTREAPAEPVVRPQEAATVKPIAPATVERAEVTPPTPVIPLIEHDESVDTNSAEARARSFSSSYAEIEDVDVVANAPIEPSETFHPVRGEVSAVSPASRDIPMIDETRLEDEYAKPVSYEDGNETVNDGGAQDGYYKEDVQPEEFVQAAAEDNGVTEDYGEQSADELSDEEILSEIEKELSEAKSAESDDDKPATSRIIRDNTRGLFENKDGGESVGYTSRVNADDNGRRSMFDDVPSEQTVQSAPISEPEPKKAERPPVPINREYFSPPFDLLENHDQAIDENKENHAERMEIIAKTLEEFRIKAVPQGFVQGPAFTRYEIMMPAGISVKSVLKYDDDLKMRLKAKNGVRIEAPIPGKDLVGIEVPNTTTSKVGFKGVMEKLAANPKKGSLVFAIGKDIVGNAISYDLAKGPHYLVAGATGSGKSVCLHALIVSLLMRYSPEELKLVLIDPKSVEFSKYDHIPHLLVDEIITDAKRAITLLQWAYDETNRRNEMFIEYPAVSNIDDYNSQVASDTIPKLPRIVFVIDELADLMEACKKDLEEKIRKIAAKSRSAGIHLVLATQRPSVDVITGTIKANLPSRIALRVMNFADSQTILGEAGAEKLLGYGDMLYKDSTMGNYERYQGAYISGREIANVVSYIIENNKAYFDDEVKEFLDNETKAKPEETESAGVDATGGEGRPTDALFVKALELAVNTGTVSISQLQRRLGIGYARAGALVDKMETAGYVTGNEGSKARRVLLTWQEFQDKFGNGAN